MRTKWNIGDKRNIFSIWIELWDLINLFLRHQKLPQKKLTLTVVELQQLPDIEKTDPNRATYCLNWTIKIGRRKVCANFNTDTGKLNIFGTVTKTVCFQMIVKLILYWQKTRRSFQNESIFWLELTWFSNVNLYWMKKFLIIRTKFVKNGALNWMTNFHYYSWSELSYEHNSVRKSFFVSAFRCWDDRLSSGEMDQYIKFGGAAVMRIHTWMWGLLLILTPLVKQFLPQI